MQLARVAGRLGALDDRLLRGPEGWRHRLALIEAANLSRLNGDRVSSDRLALWASMRLSGAQDDPNALGRVGWAFRRLTGGPGPMIDLAAFLDRRDPENIEDSAEPFADRAGGWRDVMTAATDLHPITQGCMGYHLWSLAGLGQHGELIEAVVTAARIVASDASGAIFAPLAMGGAGGCIPRACHSNGWPAGWRGWSKPASQLCGASTTSRRGEFGLKSIWMNSRERRRQL